MTTVANSRFALFALCAVFSAACGSALAVSQTRVSAADAVVGTVRVQCAVAGHHLNWSGCKVLSDDPKGHGLADRSLEILAVMPDERIEPGQTATSIATVTFHYAYATIEIQNLTHRVQFPEWAQRPNHQCAVLELPEYTSLYHKPARASLKCAVTLAGKLDKCKAVQEQPTGFQVGAAAIDMARCFKFRPMLVDGKPVDRAIITFPLQFRTR